MLCGIQDSKRAKKNVFSKQEDEKLMYLVKNCGKKLDWRTISLDMVGRTPRQCRERYMNYLDPRLVKSEWTREEDNLILNEYNKIGNRWQRISEMLCGRSASSVRNRIVFLLKLEKKKLNSSDTATESDNDIKSENISSTLLDNFEIPFGSIFFPELSL